MSGVILGRTGRYETTLEPPCDCGEPTVVAIPRGEDGEPTTFKRALRVEYVCPHCIQLPGEKYVRLVISNEKRGGGLDG